MKTKRFCELIELAISQQYGEDSEFDTVPYLPEGGGEQRKCLGIFLTEDLSMAAIAARAQHALWTQMSGDGASDEDIDEAMGDLADLMEGMSTAPYMQWICIYFPFLIQEQIDGEEAEDSRVDGVMHNIDRLADEARMVLIELREIGKIEGSDITAAEAYIFEHENDIVEYHANGMRITEIVDTIRSLTNINKGPK